MDDRTKIDDFLERASVISDTLDKDEAFVLISQEIDSCDNRFLHEYITSLNQIRNEKVLDWIEINVHRTTNIGLNWGHLAASSLFNWRRAEKWLTLGRPLSLIALDALIFCTTVDERLNQSPWMRKINPRLLDNPQPDEVAKRLNEFLLGDNVHRTRTTIGKIIDNLFDVRA
ncbi:MAG TPA: hypothetical protein VL443_09455 [Cyclobacteriaceae bacterium]|jgi:hypothetical protein|nr:hypothetical protein [Cyclobacteriaceae bacterium]